jgi:hypothetical protein
MSDAGIDIAVATTRMMRNRWAQDATERQGRRRNHGLGTGADSTGRVLGRDFDGAGLTSDNRADHGGEDAGIVHPVLEVRDPVLRESDQQPA